MNLIPTWPIAAACLAVGLATGIFADHKIMQGRIDKITIAHSEELRLREVQRAKDESESRLKEQSLTAQIATIEQAKTNENSATRSDANALIDRLRNSANSKPTSAGSVPQAAAACKAAAGPVVPERVGNDLVRLAQRADELRSALSACQQAYDSVAR